MVSLPRGSTTHVAVIGAGPYGLAAAAHLRAAGVETLVFGTPMEFWERHMPRGMRLRSSPEALTISDPRRELSLNAFQLRRGLSLEHPIGVEKFVEYGHWYQRLALGDLDRRQVLRLEAIPGGFQLTLEDGEVILSRRAVIAAGMRPFAHRPAEFGSLPAALASHSADHNDLTKFAGQQVVVIGGGQSAMECAVLLSEAGAEVEVILRDRHVRWLDGSRSASGRAGPADGEGVILVTPNLYRRLPLGLQQTLVVRSSRPSVAGWLLPRINGVRITARRRVVAATPLRGRVVMRLDDGTQRIANHVLLATGYRVDLSRYTFMASALVQSIRIVDGWVDLGPGLETAVPGLHLLGAPAAGAFGPLMRFVSGAGYAARALSRHVLAQASGKFNPPPVPASLEEVTEY